MDHKKPINYFYIDNIKSTDFCPEKSLLKPETCLCPAAELKLQGWANYELFLAHQGRKVWDHSRGLTARHNARVQQKYRSPCLNSQSHQLLKQFKKIFPSTGKIPHTGDLRGWAKQKRAEQHFTDQVPSSPCCLDTAAISPPFPFRQTCLSQRLQTSPPANSEVTWTTCV